MNIRIIALAASAVLSAAAIAAPYDYAVWNQGDGNTTTGTVNGVGVTFSGPYIGVLTNGSNNYFNAYTSDYTSSTVSNAPAASDNFIQLTGGNSDTYTLTFATPVNNLVIDVLSVGQTNDNVNLNFSAPFTLLSQGQDQWGPGTLSVTGNTLTGAEGSGAILFSGETSSLTFTLPNSEYWYGMTVATPTPEPSTMSIFALGGLGLLLRRRKRA